jgi:hypothetical protein
MGRACSTNVCRLLVGKSEGKGAIGRRQRRRENNTNMDLREIRWDDGFRWLSLARSQ